MGQFPPEHAPNHLPCTPNPLELFENNYIHISVIYYYKTSGRIKYRDYIFSRFYPNCYETTCISSAWSGGGIQWINFQRTYSSSLYPWPMKVSWTTLFKRVSYHYRTRPRYNTWDNFLLGTQQYQLCIPGILKPDNNIFVIMTIWLIKGKEVWEILDKKRKSKL